MRTIKKSHLKLWPTLYHYMKTEHIIHEMRELGKKHIEATPKLNFKTKEPHNMYMLPFRQNENVVKVLVVTDILGVRLEILTLRKLKLVPQCQVCVWAYPNTLPEQPTLRHMYW